MKHLKLSRRQLDELRAAYGHNDNWRELLDHIAALETENAALRKSHECLREIANDYDIGQYLEGYEVEL